MPAQGTLKILDDVIFYDHHTAIEVENPTSAGKITAESLEVGMQIEVEGKWKGKHQFQAEKLRYDPSSSEREIKSDAYLDLDPGGLGNGRPGAAPPIKLDGETLVLSESTKVSFPSGFMPVRASEGEARTGPALAGRLVRYRGVRQPEDGWIAAQVLEWGDPRPARAFEIGDNIKVVRANDTKTGYEILEFRKGKDVFGRLKLFPVKEVQEYVSQLGERLVPQMPELSGSGPEFRFYVIEDASINASALPDGTILVNTGLLGALENEAQLAFVLGHEIAHVTQIHQWRHVHDTRAKRVLLTIATAAGSYFIGDLATFMQQIGLLAIWNGYARRLENQADRLGLQSLIDHGYDPRQAPHLSRIFIERYGNRSHSALWSNHDSSVLRGSFLTIQIQREYSLVDVQNRTVDTPAFRAMREAMGPVKIM